MPAATPASLPLRPRSLILLLGALCAFSPFATDMYLSAFPAMAADLGTDVARVQLTLSAFSLGLCLGQLFYGPLIDSFGRRRPLLAGIALFVAASFAIAAMDAIDAVIGLRLAQAAGGCAGMVVARAVIQDVMDARHAARALSAMMMVLGLAPIVAPVFGGYVLLFGDWRWVFVSLGALGLACLYAAWRWLPETLPRERRQPLHLGNSLRAYGGLLRRAGFVAPTLSGAMALAAMFVYIGESPFVFIRLYGVDQQQYGWLFALNAAGMVAASQLNGWLLHRHGPQALMLAGAAAMAVAGALLLFVRDSPSLPVLMVPLFACIACVPAVASNTTAIAMAAGRDRAGISSSLLGTLHFGLAAVANAVAGLLHDGSTLTMSGLMLAFAVAALLLAAFTAATGRAPAGAAARD